MGVALSLVCLTTPGSWAGMQDIVKRATTVLGRGFVPNIFFGHNPFGPSINNVNIFTGTIVCKTIAADTGGSFLPSTGDEFTAAEQTPPEHPERAQEYTDEAETLLKDNLKAERLADNEAVTELKERLYGDDSPLASPDIVNNAVFSFRPPEQYGTDEASGFKLFETRWQQMNRTLFGQASVWQEREITVPGSGEKTMPYPGYAIWEESLAFVKLDHKLFDTSSGTAKVRADIDEDPTMAGMTEVTLKQGYIVTKQ